MLQWGLMIKTIDHIIILFNEPEKSLNSKHETVTFTWTCFRMASTCRWTYKGRTKGKGVYARQGRFVLFLTDLTKTGNISDCDQSNYSPYKAALSFMKVDRTKLTILIPKIYSFEIFEDGVRPPLGFGSTGSRSIRSATQKPRTPEPNMKWIGWPVAEISPIFPCVCAFHDFRHISTSGVSTTSDGFRIAHFHFHL